MRPASRPIPARWLMVCLLAPLLLLPSMRSGRASDRGLPFVHETVDEICIVQSSIFDHKRVVFLRDGKILATRLQVDEMQWVASGDGFQLIWQDYWTAERVVEAKRISTWQFKDDPTEYGQNGPWFCMFRRMTDLKQP